jgi:hypothetical protein
MKLAIHAVSDPGLQRETNEDAFLVIDLVHPSVKVKGGPCRYCDGPRPEGRRSS